MYPLESIPLPKEPDHDRDDIPPVALTSVPTDASMSDNDKRQAIAAYYASISFMDAQVGKVLDAMDRLKLWDNTVVVFMSDHGYHLGEHGLWRKHTLFEESVRAPMIFAVPGKKAGACSQIVELIDIFPTLTELCQLPSKPGVEGYSFVPLLEKLNQAWKKAAFAVVKRKEILGRNVRTDRYSYTEWGDENTAELYDHQNDPKEFTNLAKDPKSTDVVNQMKQLLRNGWKNALPPTKKENS
jgi:iduronate 2-sulfatase